MEKYMAIHGKRNGSSPVAQLAEAGSTLKEMNLDHLSPRIAACIIQELLARQEELERQNEALRSEKLEAVGQLAGGVAHHFNNMLTAILGYVDLSLDDLPADHPVVDGLQIAKRTAHRAAALTYQLLAFTRQQINRPQITNLNDLILGMETVLNDLIGETVNLSLFLTPDLKEIEIDIHHFEQLLTNLVINAREAMPEGGRLILETANLEVNPVNMRRHHHIPVGNYVALTVTDTGIGMTEQVKAHLFEPFFTTKEVGQGIGLGLSTCFGIVQQHHGYITVDSEPGEGTTFNLYFPCLIKVEKPQPTKDPGDHAYLASGPVIFIEARETAWQGLAVPQAY